MGSNMYVKEFALSPYNTLKVQSDCLNEYYTCIFETTSQVPEEERTELPHIPMEIMKGIINHMKYLCDVADKNKDLIKAKNMHMWKQFECFGLGLYVNDETLISGSIFVHPIEQIPMVGLHQNAKDFSNGVEIKSIYFTLDATNNLANVFDEAEKEFNKIVPGIKDKRKFKGVLVDKAEVEYLIHQSISEHCGHSHM